MKAAENIWGTKSTERGGSYDIELHWTNTHLRPNQLVSQTSPRNQSSPLRPGNTPQPHEQESVRREFLSKEPKRTQTPKPHASLESPETRRRQSAEQEPRPEIAPLQAHRKAIPLPTPRPRTGEGSKRRRPWLARQSKAARRTPLSSPPLRKSEQQDKIE